jgi:hypothetical protein
MNGTSSNEIGVGQQQIMAQRVKIEKMGAGLQGFGRFGRFSQ